MSCKISFMKAKEKLKPFLRLNCHLLSYTNQKIGQLVTTNQKENCLSVKCLNFVILFPGARDAISVRFHAKVQARGWI